jgi:hypothetical protein
VATAWSILIVVVLALLFAGVIEADLSWDDGTSLSPVFALYLLSAALLVSAYSFIFVFVTLVKLISRAP